MLDPVEAHANNLAVPGGLTVAQASEIIRMAKSHFEIAACALTAYDPAYDGDGRTFRAGVELIKAALE